MSKGMLTLIFFAVVEGEDESVSEAWLDDDWFAHMDGRFASGGPLASLLAVRRMLGLDFIRPTLFKFSVSWESSKENRFKACRYMHVIHSIIRRWDALLDREVGLEANSAAFFVTIYQTYPSLDYKVLCNGCG